MSKSSRTQVLGKLIDTDTLDDNSSIYLKGLPQEKPTVEWLWQEMDRIWIDKGLDNRKKLAVQDIAGFYSHPVWIANGIFTSIDTESVDHRKAIKDYLVDIRAQNLADYGGGSGILAEIITTDSDINVDIVEPYPFKFFIDKYETNSKIKYVNDFESSNYDVIIAQDVLEHVENPIEMAYQISKHVKLDGYVIFANCFYPVIECHLPSTFYLRHTFGQVMTAMGLKYVGRVKGASHALIFRRKHRLNLKRAIIASKVARASQPLIQIAAKLKNKFI